MCYVVEWHIKVKYGCISALHFTSQLFHSVFGHPTYPGLNSHVNLHVWTDCDWSCFFDRPFQLCCYTELRLLFPSNLQNKESSKKCIVLYLVPLKWKLASCKKTSSGCWIILVTVAWNKLASLNNGPRSDELSRTDNMTSLSVLVPIYTSTCSPTICFLLLHMQMPFQLIRPWNNMYFWLWKVVPSGLEIFFVETTYIRNFIIAFSFSLGVKILL